MPNEIKSYTVQITGDLNMSFVILVTAGGGGTDPPVGSPPDLSALDQDLFVDVKYNFTPTNIGGSVETWSLVAGQLPDGVVVDGVPELALSGRPNQVETQTVTLRGTNAFGFDEVTFEMDVAAVITVPNLSAANQSITQGVTFDFSPTNSGGAVEVWSIVSGTLPAGLNLDPDGPIAIWGVPLTVETQTITLRGTNVSGFDDVAFEIEVVAAGVAPDLSASNQAASVGVAFEFTPVNAGGSVTSWAITTGSLPAGLSLDADGPIVLSGTPSGVETQTITLDGSNAFGSDSVTFDIVVSAVVLVPNLTAANQSATQGVTFGFTPTNTGGAVATWSITSGTLPAGLSLNVAGPIPITGVPTTIESQSITLRGTNTAGFDEVTFSITVTAAILIDAAWLVANGPSPYYLDGAGNTYILQTNVSTDGTAFAIIADNVVFDLNGYTITYDNATPIPVSNGSFETGSGAAATGWDFTNAANAERYAGSFLANEIYDGSYSLRLAAGFGNQYVVSTGTVTLDANVTYSLSAMFHRKLAPAGTEVYVQLVTAGGSVVQEVFYSGSNNRGIQFREFVFLQGSADTYYVRAGVRNSSGSEHVFIDDIKIQRTRTYGITIGNTGSTVDYPDLTRSGTAANSSASNGTITQGTDGATWSHAVYTRRSAGIVVNLVNMTVNGANSSVVLWSAPEGSLTDCNLTSNNRTITSRDSHDGAVVQNFRGTFTGNTIHNGPHSGINMNNGTSTISGNTIKLKSKYTNAFAIIVRGNSEIFSNIIECFEGEYASRGIMVNSTAGPNIVRNNNIKTQLLRNNQEYGGGSNMGAMLGGNYGIQIESGAQNLDMYENDVTVYANEVKAFAFRSSSDVPFVNVSVYDNTFKAVGTVAEEAASTKISYPGSNTLVFEDNTLITNDMWLGDSREVSDFGMVRSTLTLEGTVLASRVMQTENWNKDLAGAVQDFQLLDPVYTSATERTRLEAASFINNRDSNNADVNASFLVDWTTTIQVRNAANAVLPGATVSILNAALVEVFAGTSDVNGRCVTTLREFRTLGATKTEYGPYAVTAVFGIDELEVVFDVDATQTIEVQLNI